MTSYVNIPVRIDIDTNAPRFSKAMGTLDAATTKELDNANIDPAVREFIRIRASQLNGCSYCVQMHTTDAAKLGEPADRINAIAVWRESPFFTAKERAALALTESITLATSTHVDDADWQIAADQFNESELAALVSLIVTINAWNLIGVSTRAWTPEISK